LRTTIQVASALIMTQSRADVGQRQASRGSHRIHRCPRRLGALSFALGPNLVCLGTMEFCIIDQPIHQQTGRRLNGILSVCRWFQYSYLEYHYCRLGIEFCLHQKLGMFGMHARQSIIFSMAPNPTASPHFVRLHCPQPVPKLLDALATMKSCAFQKARVL
jgi:hypothetical protein